MVRFIRFTGTTRALAGLEEVPYRTKLGIKIYKCVAKRIWLRWVERQTTLINEYKLDLALSAVREFLFRQAEAFTLR